MIRPKPDQPLIYIESGFPPASFDFSSYYTLFTFLKSIFHFLSDLYQLKYR